MHPVSSAAVFKLIRLRLSTLLLTTDNSQVTSTQAAPVGPDVRVSGWLREGCPFSAGPLTGQAAMNQRKSGTSSWTWFWMKLETWIQFFKGSCLYQFFELRDSIQCGCCSQCCRAGQGWRGPQPRLPGHWQILACCSHDSHSGWPTGRLRLRATWVMLAGRWFMLANVIGVMLADVIDSLALWHSDSLRASSGCCPRPNTLALLQWLASVMAAVAPLSSMQCNMRPQLAKPSYNRIS